MCWPPVGPQDPKNMISIDSILLNLAFITVYYYVVVTHITIYLADKVPRID